MSYLKSSLQRAFWHVPEVSEETYESDFDGPWNQDNWLVTVESEIKGGKGLDVTHYDPQPGTERTSPIDSTAVGEYTDGVGAKQAALHEKANAKPAKGPR